jgi:redox-sensitive bicupin YhaK (pirin superfamily)
MNTQKTIQHKTGSPLVNMGPIRLRQPIPNTGIEQVDPFLLLHHYGPYAISEFNNPFDLGPHPHRGGRGIIHAEGPTKEFVEKGGDLEGIQLWLNLPAKDKMIPAAYQHVKSEEIPIIENEDKTISLKVIAGNQADKKGTIKTQTPVNVFTVSTQKQGIMNIEIPKDHKSLIYLLDGEVLVNNEALLKKGAMQMITFNQDGDSIHIESKKESNLLILSGEPINEKVAQYGPYVMNTQTEIMEAMRDFQKGKMGYLY